ncbi:DNA damage tolerance protein RHC31 [Grifola frondosa]|uniref:DNA damage tolerance protein RHC31 n=1 Tax=Grifola frondosa TaxID=5627 RepID=A0A1C7LVS7_GRIFR|nr:DNA damage tolerance protein RHC31 [Grifola frondosa]
MSALDPGTKSIPLQITEGGLAALIHSLYRPRGALTLRFYSTKRPCMTARSGCGAWRPSRGCATRRSWWCACAARDGGDQEYRACGDREARRRGWGRVAAEDLGAGFFFHDEDVGEKRVDAARARIESLNPLVAVETLADGVDLVCATDLDRESLIRLNDACRRAGKPFYAGGTYGLLGYIFCDLLQHDYIAPDRSAQKDAGKNVKNTAVYCPLRTALEHRWSGLSGGIPKSLIRRCCLQFSRFGSISPPTGALPDDAAAATELEVIANGLLQKADVNKTLPSIPRDRIEIAATTAAHELSPCVLCQSILGKTSSRTADNILIKSANKDIDRYRKSPQAGRNYRNDPPQLAASAPRKHPGNSL